MASHTQAPSRKDDRSTQLPHGEGTEQPAATLTDEQVEQAASILRIPPSTLFAALRTPLVRDRGLGHPLHSHAPTPGQPLLSFRSPQDDTIPATDSIVWANEYPRAIYAPSGGFPRSFDAPLPAANLSNDANSFTWGDILAPISHEAVPCTTDAAEAGQTYLSYKPISIAQETRPETFPDDGVVTGRIMELPDSIEESSNPTQALALPLSDAVIISPKTPSSSTVQDAPSGPFGAAATPANTSVLESEKQLVANAMYGPCSYTWRLPTKARGGREATGQAPGKRKRQSENETPRPRQRGPFQDSAARQNAALTRRLKACIRCQLQKISCKPDPNNPSGSCLTCPQTESRGLTKQRCFRYRITDASLFRDQKRPNPIWTKRWDSMDIKDITTWKSSNMKTIQLTHGLGDVRYTLRLREFQPLEGDMLYEEWWNGHVLKKHPIPPFAIANMSEAASELNRYVENAIAPFIIGAVGHSDPLIWETYEMAVKHAWTSPRDEERGLLKNVLRLWVTSRMTSLYEKICSEEKVGTVVEDAASPLYGTVPVAPVICAQLEVITFSTLQRPLKERVLKALENMLRANDRRNWLTIYLTLFILLHSCSMTTFRDAEWARQMNYPTMFANPESITAHHVGMLTMLAFFHYCNRNNHPFKLAQDPNKASELLAVGITPEQVEFIRKTAGWIAQKRNHIEHTRQARDYGDHYYFTSQLYDEDWEPTPIA